jgi:hypothetical protein
MLQNYTAMFNVHSAEETQLLAHRFAGVMRAHIAMANDHPAVAQTITMALQGLPKLGKSTFSQALTAKLFAEFSDTSITLGPSHLCPLRLFQQRIYSWDEHYSQSAGLQVQRIDRGASMLAALLHGKLGIEDTPEPKDGASLVQLIEWPIPRDVAQSVASVRFQKVADGRKIMIRTNPDIAHSEEYAEFLDSIGDLRAA